MLNEGDILYKFLFRPKKDGYEMVLHECPISAVEKLNKVENGYQAYIYKYEDFNVRRQRRIDMIYSFDVDSRFFGGLTRSVVLSEYNPRKAINIALHILMQNQKKIESQLEKTEMDISKIKACRAKTPRTEKLNPTPVKKILEKSEDHE